MIKLKNIDLSKISQEKEFDKFIEESKEFSNVINDIDENTSYEHAVEELFDILQVGLGLIEKKYNKSADEVMKEYPKHLEKLEYRPR